jgi:hypothetical protein
MEIIFEEVVLRPWTFKDADQLAVIANNKKVTDNLLAGSIGIVTKEDIYRKNVEIGYFPGEEY